MKKTIVALVLITASWSLFAQGLQTFEDEKTGKSGYKDASGKIVVKPVYDIAYDFESNPYACVNIGADYEKNKGGKWGAIDAKGKVIIPVKYDAIAYIGYNLFAVNVGEIFSRMDATQEGKVAIFNSLGKPLTPFVYTGSVRGFEFYNGYADLQIFNPKTKENKYGLLDTTGKIAIPVIYDNYIRFSDEGIAKLQQNGKHWFVDRKGKQVLPSKYDDAKNFSEGLAAVKVNGKWGFIDIKEKEVIAPQYQDAEGFEEGYAGVKQNGKWGVVDKENKTLFPFNYDKIIWIHNSGNDIRVEAGGKYYNVDRTGKEIK